MLFRSKEAPIRLIALAMSLVVVLAVSACGGDDDGRGSGGGGGSSRGGISIDGSSTVAPLSEAIAEEFQVDGSGVNVSVATSGTGGGFKKFCAGEIDIADASRAIKEEEVAACAAARIDYVELRVALDGLVIATSSKNDFLECLSLDQLAGIFREGGAKTWDQVDPEFPKRKISIFAPGSDSGTYDFFVEEVLGDPKKPGSPRPRTDYTASEDDNTLVQGISGEADSWGYFGFAYFTENKAKLKAVEVAGEAGECVEPRDETIEDGSYPLSRPLFIYVRTSSLERPEVRKFVRFYLETTPKLVRDVGYTPAPEDDYDEGLEAIDDFS